jgi:hypothetical protein
VGLQLGVARDDAAGLVQDGRIVGSELEHARPAEDGVEGRAQLVREGGEELVLGAVDRLRVGARDALALQEGAVLLLEPRDLRHVAREAARVDELAVVPVHAGIDEDALDRAVAGAQARRVVADDLAAREAGEDVVDREPVDVELDDVASDVLVSPVAEELQLRAVRLQDRAVGAHEVQGDGAVLEEVVEIVSARGNGVADDRASFTPATSALSQRG